MSISLVGITNFVSGSSSTTTGHMNLPGGIAADDLTIAVMGFEGVTSGPWADYDPNGAHPDGEPDARPAGWVRVLAQAPSASGNGLEVWAAYFAAGTFAHFKLSTSQPFAAQIAVFRGHYVPAGGGSATNPLTAGAIRVSTSQQVSGNNPACPDVYAFQNERVIVTAADQLNSPGFGIPTSPAGFTSRFDGARASTYGNVEITLADMLALVDGDTGAPTFTATGATAGVKGATATLAIRPAATPPAATSPLISAEYA